MIPAKSGSTRFTISNVVFNSFTYQPALNHDLDGDTNGTTVVISNSRKSR